MCRMISWIELTRQGKKEILFITKHELETNRGKRLYKTSAVDDIVGHGFIEEYYKLQNIPFEESHRESDLYTNPRMIPSKFPPPIIKAIKRGDFAHEIFYIKGREMGLKILNMKARRQFLKKEREAA